MRVCTMFCNKKIKKGGCYFENIFLCLLFIIEGMFFDGKVL